MDVFQVRSIDWQITSRICYIPNDHEFDDMMHNARRKLESTSEKPWPAKDTLLNVSNPKNDDFERGKNFLHTNEKEVKINFSTLRAQFMITKSSGLNLKNLVLKNATAVTTKIRLQTEV